jgi:phosphatidylserine/phosphatidylglycerophosphate/cardiolipin synthase-like enzyme
MNAKKWLSSLEWAAGLSSVAGAVVGIVSQQAVYAAAPLSLCFLLNLANRSQTEQQQQQIARTITQLDQRSLAVQQGIQVLYESTTQSSIAPASTSLVVGSTGSKEALIEALRTAQKRVIIVSPWLRETAFESVSSEFQEALSRGIEISIGWGYESNIGRVVSISNEQWIYNKSKDKDQEYTAILSLRDLRKQYPDQLTMKLLGTHEKLLVCDSSFAVVGSHNLLSAKVGESCRELGIRTTDAETIQALIELFDNAPNRTERELRSPIAEAA